MNPGLSDSEAWIPHPHPTVGLSSGTRGLCLPGVRALRGSQHHRALQDDPMQREEKEGLGGGRCLLLLQSLPPWPAQPQPRDTEQQPARLPARRGKEQTILNVWRRQRQAESRAAAMAETGEGRGMQTFSLPLTPWVQALLGVPSCPGHPVMETIQGGHSCGVALWGADAGGLLEAKQGQGLAQGL